MAGHTAALDVSTIAVAQKTEIWVPAILQKPRKTL